MKRDVSGMTVADLKALAAQERQKAREAMDAADDYAEAAVYMAERGIDRTSHPDGDVFTAGNLRVLHAGSPCSSPIDGPACGEGAS